MGNTWAPGIERERGGTLAGGGGEGDVTGTRERETEERAMMRENFLVLCPALIKNKKI
jgi:hypothetical protein